MSTKIRLFHACPHTNHIDAYCGNQSFCQGIDYQCCSQYVEIDYGSHNIILCPQHQTRQHILNAYTYLPDQQYHTAVLTGAEHNQFMLIPDGFHPAPYDKASIRFVNLAYDVPCLDFSFSHGSFAIAHNINYQEITQYYPITPGTYRMQACICNTSYIVLTVPSLQLQAGLSYTIYITGSAYQAPYCSHNLCIDGNHPNLSPCPNYCKPAKPTQICCPCNDCTPTSCYTPCSQPIMPLPCCNPPDPCHKPKPPCPPSNNCTPPIKDSCCPDSCHKPSSGWHHTTSCYGSSYIHSLKHHC